MYLTSGCSHLTLHSYSPLRGSQPCHGEGACVNQWSYEPCCAGPPWPTERDKVKAVAHFILGLQNHCRRDCHHEIKRCLLLGKKVMTNLDSVLKSREITLPTMICIDKALVFPGVMFGCESCTITKAEHQRIDAFEPWCWRRLLRVPWTARRANQSMLKKINPEYSLEGLMLKLQYCGQLTWRANSLEKTWCWERLKAGEGDNTGWH